MTYDPIPDYVTRVLMDIRRGQEGAARAAFWVSAAIFGIPAIIGLIYWFL